MQAPAIVPQTGKPINVMDAPGVQPWPLSPLADRTLQDSSYFSLIYFPLSNPLKRSIALAAM